MKLIHGIPVTLITRVDTGQKDAFNRPIFEYVEKIVDDVLVSPVSETDIVNSTDLEGKKRVYVLGIPKGNADTWLDCRVSFFGEEFKQFGDITEGIEDLVPTRWHKKVLVAKYE